MLFEYAISQQQHRPPSRRTIGSWALSCICHGLVLFTLVEHPELLRTGTGHWLRPARPTAMVSQQTTWRTVTFVNDPARMQTPSAATLRKYMYDWEAHRSTMQPPIRIRWGNEPPRQETDESVAQTRPALGTQEPKPAPPAAAAGSPTDDKAAQTPGSESTITALLPNPSEPPKQVPPKVAETAGNTAPASLPSSIKPPPSPTEAGARTPTPAKPAGAARIFENQEKAIRAEGSGLFDTKGFPLGDYANIIIERIKSNWSIPSNLRNAQGRTTIVFFIGKSGNYTNVHIVDPSGSTSLDLAALNAILISNPFPPLPRGFPGEQVGAKFVFSYDGRQ